MRIRQVHLGTLVYVLCVPLMVPLLTYFPHNANLQDGKHSCYTSKDEFEDGKKSYDSKVGP
jgi:hypothetical protein